MIRTLFFIPAFLLAVNSTLAIEFKDVVTHDPVLYLGYILAW